VIKKEAEMISRYKDGKIKIRFMCNVTAKVIPVIIGATGTISKKILAISEQHTRKARN
jgi:hypothetical protein